MEEQLIDYDDLKVKHLSEQYMNLPAAPEPDDILYWCKKKKRKAFDTHDLIKIFGIEKLEQINKTMEWLDFNNFSKTVGSETWIDPKSYHWFYHPESECYIRMTWEEFGDENEGHLIHIGVSKTEDEKEAKGIHDRMIKGEKMDSDDGSIIIHKYELLKNG